MLKSSILTIFRDRTDHHLRDILSISRDERALRMYLRNATIRPKIHYTKVLVVTVIQKKNIISSRPHARPCRWRKSRSSHLKYHLDPAAWVLPGEINAMKNCVLCKGRHATMSDEVNVRFIALLRPFEQTKSPFVEEKSVKSPETNTSSIQRRGASRWVQRYEDICLL